MSMLHELFEDAQPLNERPYSRTQSAIDSAKGAVKGLGGSGQIEQGAQESGRVANQLWVDFKRMIGRKYGKSQASVPFADVSAFFKSNQLDASALGTNQNRTFTPKDVGAALLQAARAQTTAQYGSGDEPKQPQQSQPEQSAPSQTDAPASPAASEPSPEVGGLEGRLAALSAQERSQLLSMLG